MKYGKPDYVNQVVDGCVQPQPSSTPLGHTTSRSDSRDTLMTQLSKLVQQLCTTSVATLADSGNVACVAGSSPSWVIDSGANKHISSLLSLFSDLLPIKHHNVLSNGSSQPVHGKGVLHPTVIIFTI